MSTFNPLCMFALNEYRQLDVDNRRVIKTSLKLFVLICKIWLAAALPITGFDIIKFSSKSEIFAPPNLLIHCNSFLTVGESAALRIFYNRINGSKVLSRWPCNSAIDENSSEEEQSSITTENTCCCLSPTEAGLVKCVLRASTKSLYGLKVCGSKLAYQELALPCK